MVFPIPDPHVGLWGWMRGKQLMGPTKFLQCKCRIRLTTKGNEFAQAIQESHKIGAPVVLGDRFLSLTVTFVQGLRDFLDRNAIDPQDLGQKFEGSKVNVRCLMTTFKQVAPRLYRYTIDERDEYMAAGLDCFPRFKRVVAVIGKDHVDGVEKGIKLSGWQPVAHENKVLKNLMGRHRFVKMWRRWRHTTKV